MQSSTYSAESQPLDKRNLALLLGGMLVLLALFWHYTIRMASGPHATGAMSLAHPAHNSWGPSELIMSATMWIVMMAAMMLPTVLPWVAALAKLAPRPNSPSSVLVSAGAFIVGYLVVWSAYSVLAAGAQWLLHEKALLSSSLVATSPVFGGGLLIFAGIYQWTPAKDACLSHCRSPLGFIITSWKAGRWGAMRIGFRHGLFCVGCCWALMALSFVAGVMNLLWMALITIFIFIDHSMPVGRWLGKGLGLGLIAWGVWMLSGAW